MANDPETHAAILADAARLAGGGNLEVAADALRSSLEIEFSQEVVDVLATLDLAFEGELDREVAASAVEELAEADLDIEIEVEVEAPVEETRAESSSGTDEAFDKVFGLRHSEGTPAPAQTSSDAPVAATAEAPAPSEPQAPALESPFSGSETPADIAAFSAENKQHKVESPAATIESPVSGESAGRESAPIPEAEAASRKDGAPALAPGPTTRRQKAVNASVSSAFQTQPRRRARSMSLQDLSNMLSRSGAQKPAKGASDSKTTKVQSPAEDADPVPRSPDPSPNTTHVELGQHATGEASEVERRPAHQPKVGFKGAVSPPLAHRRQSMAPVEQGIVDPTPAAPPATAEPARPVVGESDDFDFFGTVNSGGSHLDIEPEVFTEGSLADAIAAPVAKPAGIQRSVPAEPDPPGQAPGPSDDGKEHAQAQGAFAEMMAAARAEAVRAEAGDRRRATASVAAVGDGEAPEVEAPAEAEKAPSKRAHGGAQQAPKLDSEAGTPSSGTPVVSDDAFQTGRIRPVQDQQQRRQPTSQLLDRVRLLLGRGDLASAKLLVDEVLSSDPGHGEALTLARNINERLTLIRMSALEPMDRVPIPGVGAVAEAALNPRSMFLLSMADGNSSLQDLVDLSGMRAADASEILVDLIEQGVLRF